MAFFRTGGGGGIPAALKSAMNAVLNKKFGTAQTYEPNKWPDDVNLLGALEVKTAAGAIASFSDGADDVPIADSEFAIDYTGDAISEMTIRQTGKNLLDDTKRYTTQGSTVVSMNSTGWNDKAVTLPKGDYYISAITNSGAAAAAIMIGRAGTSTTIKTIAGNAGTFQLSEQSDIWIKLTIYPGSTSDLLGVMLTTGTDAQNYESFVSIPDKTVDFDGSIYGGFYNSVTGVLTSTKASDGSDLAEPVETNIGPTAISSIFGDNNIYCDTGDTSIDYRSSGTETIIQPTLISKTITENGTYNAADDDADGYSSVSVAVHGAICERLMYARCVNNDQEEIPAISNIEQGINYSTYLSYDSSTKKFTVLQNFTGVVIAWVYAYRAYDINRPDGAFYLNNIQMLNYETTGNSEGSTGGKSGIYNFKQGDSFWVYTPTRHGYPQQNCKIYRVSDLDDDIFTLADEEEEEAVSSSRGLMMASRPVTQLVGVESDPDQVNELVENDETEQEGENDAR